MNIIQEVKLKGELSMKITNGNVFYGSKKILEIIETWRREEVIVWEDFDETITDPDLASSWSILIHSGLMPEEFVEKRNALYKDYREIERDLNKPQELQKKDMQEWYRMMLDLLIEYKLSEDIIKEAVRRTDLMYFRNYGKESLSLGIPVVIVSAGIGNVIEEFLKFHGCLENVIIIANYLNFEDGIASGYSENIIHSANKDEIIYPEKVRNLLVNRPNCIVIGDSIGDIKMIPEENLEKAIKIGFLDNCIEEYLTRYTEHFDIVYTNGHSFKHIIELINRIK